MEIKSNFAANLKRLRKQRGLTRKDMAEELKIKVSSYGFYEQGRTLPSLANALLIANILDVSFYDLVSDTQHTKVDNVKVTIDGANDITPDEIRYYIHYIFKYVDEYLIDMTSLNIAVDDEGRVTLAYRGKSGGIYMLDHRSNFEGEVKSND